MVWHTTSRHSRGYDHAWTKIRKKILKRDRYFCQCSECQGGAKRYRIAHEVHHIIPRAKGGKDTDNNLISVNRECHKRLTAEEQGRTLKRRPKIGMDGYPVDSIDQQETGPR